MSLVDTSTTKLPAAELLLGAQVGKFPVAPWPGHDISAAAGHRMTLAVSHLTTLGCKASGLISDENLASAVRSETRSHDYDRVILATGRAEGSWLARTRGRDPVHKLRRQWGQRLVMFSPGSGTTLAAPPSRTAVGLTLDALQSARPALPADLARPLDATSDLRRAPRSRF